MGRVDQGARQVVGDRGLEAHVELEGHDHRRGEQHDAERTLDLRAAPGAPDAIDDRAPAECEHEQHGGRARGVGEPDDDRAPGGRADGDHRREDRPGARRVEEPEGAADGDPRPEPVAAVLGPEARQP